MIVVIKDINSLYGITPSKLKVLLTNILREHNIKHNIGTVIDSNSVLIRAIEDNKLFISSTKNKIPMKEDDPRRISLGRNYLESERLTEAQWDITNYVLGDMLKSLGINCTVVMDEFNDSNFIPLRYTKPTSFPIAKG